MGTAVSIHVRGPAVDPAVVNRAAGACFAELHELDELFSPFRDDSAISRIRRGDLELTAADPRVLQVEGLCRTLGETTAGRFSAWRDGWFDPTGIVKGWAVDAAAERHLRQLVDLPGIEAAGVSAGGDMRLFTAADSDSSWSVGIVDVRDRTRILAVVDMRDGAVATSGTAERGAHIVDPRSGTRAAASLSATVVADDLIAADAWATAAVVAGIDDLAWIARAATRTGLLADGEGRTRRWLGATEIAVVSAAA
jgi:thiamine biosynthesis lipoprotein